MASTTSRGLGSNPEESKGISEVASKTTRTGMTPDNAPARPIGHGVPAVVQPKDRTPQSIQSMKLKKPKKTGPKIIDKRKK